MIIQISSEKSKVTHGLIEASKSNNTANTGDQQIDTTTRHKPPAHINGLPLDRPATYHTAHHTLRATAFLHSTTRTERQSS